MSFQPVTTTDKGKGSEQNKPEKHLNSLCNDNTLMWHLFSLISGKYIKNVTPKQYVILIFFIVLDWSLICVFRQRLELKN